jgi:DNA-directed RNA polymerase subunit N (RpoN/RPB10)
MTIKTTPPPRCLSCHMSLGHVYEIYMKEYRKRVELYMQENGLLLGDLSSMTDNNIVMGDVLTSLGVRRLCCRTHMLGHKNI